MFMKLPIILFSAGDGVVLYCSDNFIHGTSGRSSVSICNYFLKKMNTLARKDNIRNVSFYSIHVLVYSKGKEFVAEGQSYLLKLDSIERK